MVQIFDDITVLDFSQVVAGPTISRFFAELGADVIKVELPPAGDGGRQLPYRHPVDGRSAYHVQQNRGKRSVCIDPRDPEGHAAVMALLPRVDVVIESFSPGTIARLGFGWDVVHAANPRIVMVSVSAFGQEGPLARKPGYDNIVQAYSGVMSMIGEPGEAPPIVNAAVGDVLTGVHGFGAVAAALYHRERTGQGQLVEVSLLDSYVQCHEINVQAHSASGGSVEPTRSGSHHYAVTPFGVFRAGDRFIIIGAIANDQWPRLCHVMNRNELADDPRFVDNAARCEHRDEVIAIVEGWLAEIGDVDTAVELLDAGRVPCAPVLSVAEAMRHPHLRERDTIRTVTDRSFGTVEIPGFPLRFSAAPDRPELEAAYLGEHNAEVLVDVAGLDPAVVQQLADRGVLHGEPRANPGDPLHE